MLELTVPRRIILAALLATANLKSRPILGHVCFEPDPDDDPNERESDDRQLIATATTGHLLVTMTGGSFTGEFPESGELLVRADELPKKRARGGIMESDVSIVFTDPPDAEDGHPGVVEVKDKDGRFYGKHDREIGRFPDCRKVLADHFDPDQFPIASRTLPVNPERLLDALEAVKLFHGGDPARGDFCFAMRRPAEDERDIVPVFRITSDTLRGHTFRGLVMGLRLKS